MIDRRFRDLASRLQGKKPHMPHFLQEVRLRGIRGIDDLRVVFDYPVTVIAGGNASGKSTVLFAAACAYRVPGAGVRDYVPSTLFPDYRPKSGQREDERPEVDIEFHYVTPDDRESMRWRRVRGWNRSFFGRKGATQPERQVYLRTLSNLSNPSEVRGVLSMSWSKAKPEETPLTASQIAFAQRMLPFSYGEVVDLSSGNKKLLFAEQDGGAAYSELHMAAGERAILRLSQEIAQLKGALVLIDEVEAGLHPWVQKLLMLEFQQLALRNDLQVIVTSHSPVILDSVPDNGRVFLDRDDTGKVTVQPAYRDIIQNALYGQSNDALNILCEDAAAEGVINGILDHLAPIRGIRSDAIRIGRNAGAKEFPAHASAFSKFGQIQNFVFVLDGDVRAGNIPDKIREQAGPNVPILFIPGSGSPEIWVWESLGRARIRVASEFGITPDELSQRINNIDAIYDSASDSQSNIHKNKLYELADVIGRSTAYICRIVARLEAASPASEIQPLLEGIDSVLENWRAE